MPQRTQNQQQFNQLSSRLLAELIEEIARGICLTIEVFLHANFGVGYIGAGVMGVLVIFLSTYLFPDQDIRAVLWFMAVFGVVWVVHGTITLIRFWRGRDTTHSKYNGRPYLCRLFSTWRETTVKHLEAMAVIALGYGIHRLNQPLGDDVMGAATLAFLRISSFTSQQRGRAIAMNDRAIEQKWVAERFRDMHEP